VDRVCAFQIRQSDKNRGAAFCETKPIFSAAIEAPLRATLEGGGVKILKPWNLRPEAAVEFIPENGGSVGVRLAKRIRRSK